MRQKMIYENMCEFELNISEINQSVDRLSVTKRKRSVLGFYFGVNFQEERANLFFVAETYANRSI